LLFEFFPQRSSERTVGIVKYCGFFLTDPEQLIY
jgi:hypothetical protein